MMIKIPKIFIAAGGTGGHMFPALAVASEFNKRNIEVVFIGTGKDIEKNLIKKFGYRYEVIDFTPITGKGLVGLLKALVKFPLGIIRALQLMRIYKPEAVIGFGGYPSVIPIIAGAITKKNVFIQEQNIKVGLANKVLSVLCKKIFAVHGASGFWKENNVTFISNPVREEFANIPEWQSPKPGTPLVILVVGGSQGAVALNSAIIETLDLLAKHQVTVIHQTGEADYDRCHQAYQNSNLQKWQVLRFIDDIASEYSKAHLIICRAGAMTVAEVVASARPAIFIPLNIAGGHQALNAAWVAEAGGAKIIEQTPSLAKDLRIVLEQDLEKGELLEKMAINMEKVKQCQDQPSIKIICDNVLS